MPRRKKRSTGRNPGGQPGNKNALKHGLWATRTANPKAVSMDLRRDIGYLEGVLEQLSLKLDETLAKTGLITDKEKTTFYVMLATIEARVTAMRAHAFLSGEMSELEKEIEEGLFLARQDLGILDYLTPPQRSDS